jgi:glycosyltransferase involved in cell wall biosynthesis
MIRRVVNSTADLVDLYNGADIFLFPSRLEGFGYAVGEAMACGKPVVCTDASSLPELVVDEKGGLLCQLDSVDEFSDKVRLLGRDEQLRRTMGEFNRNRIVSHFNISQMGASYGELYRRSI